MTPRKIPKQPVLLLKNSFNILVTHPIILLPFAIVAFIHFIVLEILFFAPRFPLSMFFAPLIQQVAGEHFLHYPYNFILMMNWYYVLQVPLYVIFNSYFIGVAVSILHAINNGEKVRVGHIFRQTLSRYLYIFMSALLAMLTWLLFNYVYLLMAQKVALLPPKAGLGGMLNHFIVTIAPYGNIIWTALITTIFAFVIPLMTLEKLSFSAALQENFSILKRSFGFIFFVILLPYLLYLPFVFLRMSKDVLALIRLPDLMLPVLMVAVCVLLFVEAIQYTMIMSYYLLRKETT